MSKIEILKLKKELAEIKLKQIERQYNNNKKSPIDLSLKHRPKYNTPNPNKSKNKIDKKIAALEVYKHLKTIKSLCLISIVGLFSTIFATMLGSMIGSIITIIFVIPIIFFLYKSNQEIQRLQTKYNLIKPKLFDLEDIQKWRN